MCSNPSVSSPPYSHGIDSHEIRPASMEPYLNSSLPLSTREQYNKDTYHLFQPLSLPKRVLRSIARLFGFEDREYFNGTQIDCVSSSPFSRVDADPDVFPIYTTDQFPITNATYMSQFPSLPPIYLVLPHANQSCAVDIANVLPPFLQSIRNASVPMPVSDKEWRDRNAIVDRDIIEREQWAQKTEAYKRMRGASLAEVNGVLPSDHLGAKYSRFIYKDVRNLETMIVEKLYEEMKGMQCMRSVVKRFEEMKKELSITEAEEKRVIREELEKNQESPDGVVPESAVLHEFNSHKEALTSLRRFFFYTTSYKSEGAHGCDGCYDMQKAHPLMKTVSFPDGVVMRCFIGNREIPNFHGVHCLRRIEG